ncbi:TonB-dependent receptor [Fretibacter rubidus]|uniref:TonB-dependent receptor n=1 Tax=Fretibacter rubidus TaxID=570162 RepID=UPI00352B76A9
MFKKSTLLSSSILAVSLIATAPAYAQVEDEIIVTATKRQTTLQDTPIAVSVTSQETIENARILDISDLQSIVPALKVTTLQTSTNTNFIIRGFGNGANNPGIEPSVGVFVDGVYRSRSAAQIGDLPNLERVEVLKGPQSTLFGKNASAGVISVVTSKPSFEPEGYAEIGIGNYNQRIVRGYASGGLTDDFAVSLGGSYQVRDGYAEAVLPGLTDSNTRDRFNLRAQALYEPSDTVSLRLIGDVSSIDEVCCVVTNIQNQGVTPIIQGLGGQIANDLNPFEYKSFNNKDSENFVDDYGVSFHADVDLGYAALTSISSYRSNTNGSDQDADFGTLALLDSVNFRAEIDTITQELRLSSQDDSPFQWMIGGYYFTESIESERNLEYGTDLQPFIAAQVQQGVLGLTGGTVNLPNILATLEPLFGFGPQTFLGGDSSIKELFTQENTAYSVFANVDYSLTDQLTLTLGGNFTDDSKTVTGRTINTDIFSSIDLFNDNTLLGVPVPDVLFGNFFTANTNLAPTPANIAFIESVAPGTSAQLRALANGITGALLPTQFQPQFVNFPNSVEDGTSSDDKFTYIARLAYEVNDNLNVYGSYGTGFKSTSWNLSGDSRPFARNAGALGSAGLLQNNQTFSTRFAEPETATVIEFGLKSRFENGAVNVAVFDQTIDNFQSNIFGGVGFFLANAGEQSVRGAEIDVTYTPIDPFTLTFGGMYLDAKYDSFVNGQGPDGPTDLSGQTPSGIAEFSMSTSGTYTHDFGNGTDGYIRADFQYESPTQVVDNIATLTRSDGSVIDAEREIKTVNAAMGINMDNGVSVQLWARNLLNDEYYLSIFPGVAQAGVINAYPNAPRTYGANIRYTF